MKLHDWLYRILNVLLHLSHVLYCKLRAVFARNDHNHSSDCITINKPLGHIVFVIEPSQFDQHVDHLMQQLVALTNCCLTLGIANVSFYDEFGES